MKFLDTESEYGLLAALYMKLPIFTSADSDKPTLGACNEPEMEEDTCFKNLFVQNLHPIVSNHLGFMACPHKMPSRGFHG